MSYSDAGVANDHMLLHIKEYLVSPAIGFIHSILREDDRILVETGEIDPKVAELLRRAFSFNTNVESSALNEIS